VRQQAHLSDEPPSRYSAISILGATTPGESSREVDDGHHDVTVSGTGPHAEAPMRHMSLFDLIAFGVGCTIGSGVFVLAGVAANQHAGPSSSISYLIAGAVATLSGLPYAELSAAFPMDGSTYSYAYITLGEVWAVMSSLCQTLEYGVTSAAVARSWGNKFVDYVSESASSDGSNGGDSSWGKYLETGTIVNPMAAAIALITTMILLFGVKESKFATNIISSLKVLLISFMIVGGFLLASPLIPQQDPTNPRPASFMNWSPFVPPEFGFRGISEAASILFFAFLGFDMICNLSGESKNPVKDVPRAVVSTLMIDAVIYMLAALSLTAMLPYTEISTVSGFPRAFGANGWVWAEKMTALGEIVTLPLVVMTSTQSQTRLFFAMSKDKLLPEFFSRLSFTPPICIRCIAPKEEKVGNLTSNLYFCGLSIVLLSLLVPFHYLDDLISAGALFLFSITNCCLLTLRYKCPSETFLGTVEDIDDRSVFSIAAVRRELSLGRILIMMNVFSFASGLCFVYIPLTSLLRYVLSALFALLTFGVAGYIAYNCKENSSTRFALEGDGYGIGRRRFKTPWVPFLPTLGIFANWFMIAYIGWVGIVMLLGYLFVGVIVYGSFCSGKSLVNSSTSLFSGGLGSSRKNEDLHEALLLDSGDVNVNAISPLHVS
jgi:APA family basic amino acid/polyamine antiporter